MRTLFVTITAAGFLVAHTHAADIGKGTEHLTAQIGGNNVHYYVQLPKGYDPKKTYGLIVHIPGKGADKGSIEKNQAVNYVRRFMFTSGVNRNYISVALWYTGNISDHSGLAAVAATKGLIELARKTYPVDAQRIFILGFSAGGITVHNLVWGNHYTKENFPFAGVIFCSANGRADYSNKNVPREMPVIAENGDKGEVVNCSGIIDGLKKAGYKDCEFHLIKGQGHAISDPESKLPVNAQDLIAKWLERVDKKFVK